MPYRRGHSEDRFDKRPGKRSERPPGRFGKDRPARPRRPETHPEKSRPQDADAFEAAAHEVEPSRIEHPKPVVDIPAGMAKVRLRHVNYSAQLYDQMVDQVIGHPRDGELVAVLDKRGDFFGWGFYHGQSKITLRMISHAPVMPGPEFIPEKIAQAVSLRRDVLKLDAVSDAYRLVHAEGDGLSGLIADRFGEFVVIELFSLAMFQRLEQIEDAFIDAGLSVKEFIVRADRAVAEREGFWHPLSRRKPPKQTHAIITENGVKFRVDLSAGHKTGFFCDQRENRLALTKFTAGKRVLDVCCYSGGFSCYAATLGSAESVTAVDLDEKAIAIAEQNAALNGAAIEFTHADAFDYLRQAQEEKRRWDVVIVDPSKFVAKRDQMELGLHKYSDLNRLAAGVVAPGGLLLTCSCSGLVDQPTFIDTVGKAARYAGREMHIFRVAGAASDHPFMPETPSAVYLKAVWGRIV